MGKVFKGLMTFTVAAAAVGGVCYAFRDKIRESKIYQEYDMDEKINKVKNTIKEKMPKRAENEEDFVDEDEIFFDDLDLAAEDVERDYVDLQPEEASTEETKADADDDSSEAVPTIDV